MNRFDDFCPICFVGKNSKKYGGNKNCFHCNTCWFNECEGNTAIKTLKLLKHHLVEFYRKKTVKIFK